MPEIVRNVHKEMVHHGATENATGIFHPQHVSRQHFLKLFPVVIIKPEIVRNVHKEMVHHGATENASGNHPYQPASTRQ